MTAPSTTATGHAASPLRHHLQPWLSPRRKRFWLLALVLAYTLAGFLLAPWLLARELSTRLGAALEQPVSIGQLRINPYVLSLEIRKLTIGGEPERPLLGFERLYLNLQLSSLVHRALVLRELSLEAPLLHLTRFADGRIDLLETLERAAGEPAPESGGEAQGLRLRIAEAALRNGVLVIEDRVPPTDFHTRIGPVNVQLADLSTLPDEVGEQRVQISAAGGLRLAWSGDLALSPFASAGRLEASGPWLQLAHAYLADRLNFALAGGELDLRLDYRLETRADGTLAASIAGLRAGLSALDLRHPDGAPLAAVAAIRLSDGSLRWPEAELAAGALLLDQPALHLVRSAEGAIDWLSLLKPGEGEGELPGGTPDAAGEPAGTPWQARLDTLRIEGLTLAAEDQVPAESARVEIARLDLQLDELSLASGASFPLRLDLSLASGGTASLSGELGLLPAPRLETTLRIEALALAPLQPWLAGLAPVRLTDGALSAELALGSGPDDPLRLDGSTRLQGVELWDVRRDERLLGWQQLGLDRLRLSLADHALAVSQVLIEGPYLRFFIDEDGNTNFGGLLAESGDEAAEPEVTASPAAPFRVSVDSVLVREGSSDFTDLSLPIPFRTFVRDLAGEVSALSTYSREPARIRLGGQVGEFGLARLEGALQPADITATTDLSLEFRNVPLPDLSPYTIKFAGRRIDDGRLDLALRYRVTDGQLRGDNRLLIQRLRLGERVPYPDAVDLPLALAVALLRGPDGSIDLALPVTGDVNSPQFSLGGVIGRAFVNLITRMATSPFRLLGSLVGVSGEDFGRIDFPPGSAQLEPPEREQLVQIAQALSLRPQLALEIPLVSAGTDAPALAAASLEASVAGLLAAAPDDQRMLGERRRGALEQLYRQRFPDEALEPLRDANLRGEPAVLDEPAYLQALRERLLATESPDPQALDELAAARAATISGLLLASAPELGERIRPGPRREVSATARDRVPLELEVDVVR